MELWQRLVATFLNRLGKAKKKINTGFKQGLLADSLIYQVQGENDLLHSVWVILVQNTSIPFVPGPCYIPETHGLGSDRTRSMLQPTWTTLLFIVTPGHRFFTDRWLSFELLRQAGLTANPKNLGYHSGGKKVCPELSKTNVVAACP